EFDHHAIWFGVRGISSDVQRPHGAIVVAINSLADEYADGAFLFVAEVEEAAGDEGENADVNDPYAKFEQGKRDAADGDHGQCGGQQNHEGDHGPGVEELEVGEFEFGAKFGE